VPCVRRVLQAYIVRILAVVHVPPQVAHGTCTLSFVITSTEDLCPHPHRYDLELSDKPYKALRYHTTGLRGVAFHRSYPLFASCADDAAVHVFHGMVRSVIVSRHGARCKCVTGQCARWLLCF